MSDRVVLDGELSLSNVLDGQGGTYNRYDWRGYSAYEVAVQEGFVGTKAEWLASLQGATGPKGDQGVQGQTGPQGPKGDPGDDYILTEQDKQEIAGLVDTPVDDVQINGTSIVTDGVANVPIASNSVMGVAKFNVNNGVEVYDNTWRIVSASSAQIKGGAEKFRPVTPQRQHEATFYSLAKAAGDTTQSQSSNAVGTYTEDAKIAIQKMLGIYQAPWELIREDTFTNAEEADHIIDADANGEPFELTDVVLELIVPTHNEDTVIADYNRVYFSEQNVVVAIAYLGSSQTRTITANSAIYMAIASVTQDNGLMCIGMNQWASRTNRNNKQILIEEGSGSSAPYRIKNASIDSIKIGKITGSMEYRIYGRRKWQ